VPLNSTQLYVKGILDGLMIPGVAKPLTVHVTPPNIEQLDGPRAYVWGGRLRGQRQTAPRIHAFKKLSWEIDVYLSYLTVAGTATVDQEFPVIVDAIMAATWQVEMPLIIDSQGQRIPTGTGATQVLPEKSSQILSIGEEFQLEYPPERNPATMRMLYYTCRLGLDVTEVVQG
jgi:hypothetical protein